MEALLGSAGVVDVPTASAVEGYMPEDGWNKKPSAGYYKLQTINFKLKKMPEDGWKRMTGVRRMTALLYWVEKMMFDCASSVRCAAGTATIPADDYRATDGY